MADKLVDIYQEIEFICDELIHLDNSFGPKEMFLSGFASALKTNNRRTIVEGYNDLIEWVSGLDDATKIGIGARFEEKFKKNMSLLKS